MLRRHTTQHSENPPAQRRWAVIPTGTQRSAILNTVIPTGTQHSAILNTVIPTGTQRSGVEWRNLHSRQRPNLIFPRQSGQERREKSCIIEVGGR